MRAPPPTLVVVRAILIVNPQATSTTVGGRDVLAHALASELQLDVVETDRRWHAAEISEEARRYGVELIVAHGGDGTVNEVVNGMLAPGHDGPTPLLGVVPGGSANVFARALGLPKDPVEATHTLLEAIAARRSRRVNLGMADDRWFTFSAGLGWDADVVAGVDKARGKKASPVLYTRIATTSYFLPPRGRPKLSLEVPGQEDVLVRTVFVSNTDPWSYLGPVPLRLNPGCSLDGGIGVFAPKTLDPISVLGYLRQAVSPKGCRGGRGLVHHDDLEKLTVRCEKPVNLQVDGDLVGERTHVEFTSVPGALSVMV